MVEDNPERPRLGRVVARGWRRRCPRCGEGEMFRGWYRLVEHCDACGLPILPRPGDMWGFWTIGDRVFVIVPLALLFFGFTPEAWWARVLFLVAVLVPLIWTMPRRLGVCIALDYLSRIYLGDDTG